MKPAAVLLALALLPAAAGLSGTTGDRAVRASIAPLDQALAAITLPAAPVQATLDAGYHNEVVMIIENRGTTPATYEFVIDPESYDVASAPAACEPDTEPGDACIVRLSGPPHAEGTFEVRGTVHATTAAYALDVPQVVILITYCEAIPC